MDIQNIPTTRSIPTPPQPAVNVKLERPMLFSIIEDHAVLRNTKGVYRQAKLALRGGHVYAAIGGGFVMLYANGITSNPLLRWEEIENVENYEAGRLGRLMVRRVFA